MSIKKFFKVNCNEIVIFKVNYKFRHEKFRVFVTFYKNLHTPLWSRAKNTSAPAPEKSCRSSGSSCGSSSGSATLEYVFREMIWPDALVDIELVFRTACPWCIKSIIIYLVFAALVDFYAYPPIQIRLDPSHHKGRNVVPTFTTKNFALKMFYEI
jgi:hypothetical protein